MGHLPVRYNFWMLELGTELQWGKLGKNYAYTMMYTSYLFPHTEVIFLLKS